MAAYTGVLIYTNQYFSVTQSTIVVPASTDTRSINSGHQVSLTILDAHNGKPDTVVFPPTIFGDNAFSVNAFGGDIYFTILPTTSTSSSSPSSSSSLTQSTVAPASTTNGTTSPVETSRSTVSTTSHVQADTGLSITSGALACIVLGVAVAVALSASVLTILFIRHRRRNKKQLARLEPGSTNAESSITANGHIGGSTMVESDPHR